MPKMGTRSPWLVMTVDESVQDSDAELVRRSQSDLDAFVALYDRYVDAVFRYCNRRLPTDAAEDATSITFLNAMAAIPKLSPRQVESFRAWLFTIAHNAVIDQLRRRQHLPIDEIEVPEVDLSLDDRAIFNDHRRQLSQARNMLNLTPVVAGRSYRQFGPPPCPELLCLVGARGRCLEDR